MDVGSVSCPSMVRPSTEPLLWARPSTVVSSEPASPAFGTPARSGTRSSGPRSPPIEQEPPSCARCPEGKGRAGDSTGPSRVLRAAPHKDEDAKLWSSDTLQGDSRRRPPSLWNTHWCSRSSREHGDRRFALPPPFISFHVVIMKSALQAGGAEPRYPSCPLVYG